MFIINYRVKAINMVKVLKKLTFEGHFQVRVLSFCPELANQTGHGAFENRILVVTQMCFVKSVNV